MCSKKWLYNQYIVLRKNSGEISKILGVHQTTVLKRLRKHNITVRTTSQSLKGKLIGKNNPNYRHGKQIKRFTECYKCSKKVTSSCQSGLCKKCSSKIYARKRKNFKNLTTKKYRCRKCDSVKSYKHNTGLCRKCFLEKLEKESPKCNICKTRVSNKYTKYCRKCYTEDSTLNSNWNGGIGNFPYPQYFNKKLKKKIRERDNHKCQGCGVLEKDHYKRLDVHHIDYNKDNCNENNLITLCSVCNSSANYNRDYWFAYYRYIIDNWIRE